MGNVALVKKVREVTGGALSLCKEAVEKTNYDEKAAIQYVYDHWKPANPKDTKANLIVTQVHQGRIGVMLEVCAATDFVVKTETFQTLAKELALQLIGGLEGPLEDQVYCRDTSKKVRDIIDEASKKVGEQIQVLRSIRWEAGQVAPKCTHVAGIPVGTKDETKLDVNRPC